MSPRELTASASHRRQSRRLDSIRPRLIAILGEFLSAREKESVLEALESRIDTQAPAGRKAFYKWAVERAYWFSRLHRRLLVIAPVLFEDLMRTVPGLGLDDYMSAVYRIANHLFDFIPGQPFAEWCAVWAEREAWNVLTVEEWLKRYGHYVRGTLASFLYSEAADLGACDAALDEIEARTWDWTLNHVAELQKPGTASLPTRICGRGHWEVRAWKSKCLRWRARWVSLQELLGDGDGDHGANNEWRMSGLGALKNGRCS